MDLGTSAPNSLAPSVRNCDRLHVLNLQKSADYVRREAAMVMTAPKSFNEENHLIIAPLDGLGFNLSGQRGASSNSLVKGQV